MLGRLARRAVAILGLLIVCCSHGRPSVYAASATCNTRRDLTFLTAGSGASQAVVAALACATARVRGLTARTPVAVRLVDATTLRTWVLQIGRQETAMEPITATTMAFQLLGALGPHDDLAAIRRGQYNPSTAAEYDPHSKTLYVRETGGRYSPLDRAVIAHEYTRALQDQYFNLASLISTSGNSLDYNSDALLARQAVVEGDAITTMTTVAAETFSRQDLLTLNKQLQQQQGNENSDFAHDLLGFPAAQGISFIKAIMQGATKNKHGAAAQAAATNAVNATLTNPPSASAEVLNPTLYTQHARLGDPAQTVPVVALGSGWTEVGSDVMGAFAIDDLLGAHGSHSASSQQADMAAAQWQSDRWAVYQHGGDTLIIWRAHFASPTGAQAFARAMVAYTAARFHTNLAPQTTLDWHTTGYAMSVRQQNADIVVAIGSRADLLSLCSHAVALLGFS